MSSFSKRLLCPTRTVYPQLRMLFSPKLLPIATANKTSQGNHVSPLLLSFFIHVVFFAKQASFSRSFLPAAATLLSKLPPNCSDELSVFKWSTTTVIPNEEDVEILATGDISGIPIDSVFLKISQLIFLHTVNQCQENRGTWDVPIPTP